MILTFKTDNPVAELSLYSKSGERCAHVSWQAHRELSETIHFKLEQLLKDASINSDQIEAIIYFAGPGSFTGLRIGAAFCNALGYSLNTPIANANGDTWVNDGLKRIGDDVKTQATPMYDSDPKVTIQKK